MTLSLRLSLVPGVSDLQAQGTMAIAPPEEWQFWESLSISRLPLSFVLKPTKRSERTQMIGFSDGAFVHRMFDLFFTIRQDWVIERLTPFEKRILDTFQSTWLSLPWKPIEAHPHVSEIPDRDLQFLVIPARHLDYRLSLRTDDTLVPVVYRLLRGWKKQRMPSARSPQNT